MKYIKNIALNEEVGQELKYTEVNLKDPKVTIKYDIVDTNTKKQANLHIYKYNDVYFHAGKSISQGFYAIIGRPDLLDGDKNSKYYDYVIYAPTMKELIKNLPEKIQEFKDDNDLNG